MQVRKTILQILCFFCILTTASAQYKLDKPLYINKESGLPTTNEVGHIRKGEDGFMWIGSPEGLCRFDGHSVKIYHAGDDLQHSLFDNYIWNVLPIKNFIWLSGPQGISVLNTKDNTFRHYQIVNNKKADSITRRLDQGVNILYKDRSGTIWVGSRESGVYCYDQQKDDFRFFGLSREKYPRLHPSVGWDESTLSIVESQTNDSIIWAGTPAGLKKINKFSGDVKLYTFPKKDKDYQIALNAFLRLYQHDDGLLYTGSWAAGINVFDPVAETLTPLAVKNEKAKKLLTDPTFTLIRKSNHEIWISTGLGLAVYDTELKDITWLKYNNDQKDEYYGIEYIDDANRVWHRTRLGAACFDPVLQQFSTYSFRSLSNVQWAYAFYIVSDKTGNNITVCPRQTDGIYHFSKITKEWTKTLFPNSEIFTKERQAIRGFVQMPTGDYLISADKGIFLFSEKQNKIAALHKHLPFDILKKGELLLSRSGYVWMALDNRGIVKWKPGTSDYTIYKVPSASGDSSDYPQWFTHFFEDSKGNIWFQTSNGLGVFIAAKNSAVNFNYLKNVKGFPVSASSFAEDKNGKVWFTGNDGWMGYAASNDPAKGMIYKFNVKERGLQGTVYELAADLAGQVWGFDSKELIKINPDDLSFTTYSFQYGINEADFFHFSFLPSGEIIFGGRNDISIADPKEFKRNKELPVPYIDQLQVLNQPFDFVRDGSGIKLGYKQNFFSIGFSALAFTLAKDVKFRYRLKGFDDWSHPTRRRFANYTNVPGGDYVFELQAANNEGVWNPKTLEIPVHIDTAFWNTWWFSAMAILLLAFAVYSLYRYRLRLAKKKQELKGEYEKKLANVEMTALLAQMNPHFIFNSLNSIDSYIIRNESKQASEYLNNFAMLIRLILQNSRSNYITLKDELVALGLYLQMESLRFKNKFSYTIHVEGDLDINSTLIPPMLIQPYVENAIWHGLMCKNNGEAGKVDLGIYKREDNLLCIIADNGIGRKKAAEIKQNKINNHKRSMGMQITKDRMEIINKLYNLNTSVHIYDIEGENGEATGTRVELVIPI